MWNKNTINKIIISKNKTPSAKNEKSKPLNWEEIPWKSIAVIVWSLLLFLYILVHLFISFSIPKSLQLVWIWSWAGVSPMSKAAKKPSAAMERRSGSTTLLTTSSSPRVSVACIRPLRLAVIPLFVSLVAISWFR